MMNSFILIIFGATGDLAHNKLIPSLFSLYKEEQLPKEFFIIGFARRDLTNEAFIALFHEYQNDPLWETFAQHLFYHQGSFEEKEAYVRLIKKLQTTFQHPTSHIFYLATPPQNYDTILHFLHTYKRDLSQKIPHHERLAKLVIEKPFGKDVETAKKLDQLLHDYFNEWQVFRVDHYLGKETVQNMLIFRFANSIFEPVWNNQYIDHVQITFAEEKGIGNRGKFFDGVGMLRDVGQNHLLQLLAAVAMEQPKSFSREGVRDARAAVIAAMKPYQSHEIATAVIRGQYSGYLLEKDVLPDSRTETFVTCKLFLNTERFAGVPFYIRAGKKLAKNLVEISVVFKQTCHLLFKEIGCPEQGNVLTFYIQPDEGIGLRIIAKNPGGKLMLGNSNMHFLYKEQFASRGIDAYEKILLDIFAGDQMLFNRSDELASSWEFITKILQGWDQGKGKLLKYEEGTWGPKEAEEMIERDGRKWI